MSAGDVTGRLIALRDTDKTVADPAADVRGRPVYDSTGDEVGRVEDLLIDDEEARVRFLGVGAGGFLGVGKDHFLIPVDAIAAVDDDGVRVSRERARMHSVPVYDPQVSEDPAYYSGVYAWWGYQPYWAPGYIYPPFPYGI